MRAVPAALLAGAATVLVLAEGLTSWASHDGLPARRRRVGPGGVVLVLGYPSRSGGRISWMQRWRVRIAVRSAGPGARFVFSGGAPTGPSEAAVMARHAQRRWRVPEERILLEERSRFTWENVALSLPHLRDAERIVFASNTFHARRARRYLARQDPELAGRLRRAADRVPGELLPLRPALVLHELVRIRRARRLRVGTRGEESSTR